MDIIFIEQLKIETLIGIYPWEQEQKQTVLIDVEMGWDTKTAGNSNNIKDTIDYAAVAKFLTDHISSRSYQLLENLAEEIAEMLHATFSISQLKIRISKPEAVHNASNVGVVIERQYLPNQPFKD